MGNLLTYAGLLLDECDFGINATATAAEAVEIVSEHLEERFAPEIESTPPIVGVRGVTLERLDVSITRDHALAGLPWIGQGLGFRETMIQACITAGLPRPLAEAVVTSADFSAVEADLLEQIQSRLKARQYARAAQLTDCLPRLSVTGLPMVRHESWVDRSGGDEMYDFRIANYGPGTRLLALLEFDWG